MLVTGAGGSIGAELCRQIYRFAPATLIMVDRDESALHGVQLSILGRALLDGDDLVVADIRDEARVLEVFETHRPQVVFHAAALKHLTLLEKHPAEGAKTNVLGTLHVLRAAMATAVDHFVNMRCCALRTGWTSVPATRSSARCRCPRWHRIRSRWSPSRAWWPTPAG